MKNLEITFTIDSVIVEKISLSEIVEEVVEEFFFEKTSEQQKIALEQLQEEILITINRLKGVV